VVALNLGGVIRLSKDVLDEDDVLTNPSAATLTITQPDGTLAAGIVVDTTPTDVGVLVYDFTPTQAGRHSVHWATTGPTTAEDDMFVAEPPARLLVSVDETVSHLRATGVITSDADREQLQWLCLVVSEAVEDDLGRTIMRRTVTETHSGGSSTIILKKSPVISITSATESGASLAASGYSLDSATGIVTRLSGAGAWWWASGFQNIGFVYVPGYANPPKSTRMVALTALQNLYQTSQTRFHPALDESAEFAVSSAVAGLPDPLRSAYEKLRAVGVA
jgi:hypothetical protein